MLEALITSKTRIKLILKFFMNPESSSYLRGLAEEFGESTNAIRVELNRFEKAGLLESEALGNKKMFKANVTHPLFMDLQQIVQKTFGIDKIVDQLVKELGDVEKAYLVGSFARGQNGKTVDIVLVGNDLNMDYLLKLIAKVEKLIGKKLRYLVLAVCEAEAHMRSIKEKVLIYNI